jgi:hypothetical protein
LSSPERASDLLGKRRPEEKHVTMIDCLVRCHLHRPTQPSDRLRGIFHHLVMSLPDQTTCTAAAECTAQSINCRLQSDTAPHTGRRERCAVLTTESRDQLFGPATATCTVTAVQLQHPLEPRPQPPAVPRCRLHVQLQRLHTHAHARTHQLTLINWHPHARTRTRSRARAAAQTCAWYGMVWHGMVWYGMVWHGMAWHGMAWYGMVWYGMVAPS